MQWGEAVALRRTGVELLRQFVFLELDGLSYGAFMPIGQPFALSLPPWTRGFYFAISNGSINAGCLAYLNTWVDAVVLRPMAPGRTQVVERRNFVQDEYGWWRWYHVAADGVVTKSAQTFPQHGFC